jgi:D-alanyl-lipoteichoic acid acyltransferase DltB (MBOAT superfamily)
MLFNSPIFIFYFLPIAVVFGLVAQRRLHSLTLFVLVLSIFSLYFYSYTKFNWLYILLLSLFVNYTAGSLLSHTSANRRVQWIILVASVSFNLLLLGYFKYANFFIENLEHLFSYNLTTVGVVLPIGISFYTFQQIAFIVDAYHGHVRDLSPLRYVFFIAFFPQLIAGPIVHHSEILPQLTRVSGDTWSNLATGTAFFLMGLTKKVLIADSLAQYVTPVFAAADVGTPIATADAWIGTFAYAFQIYFDFSGYSDMAIGIGQMFGLRLPENFNSPYRARSMIEFWRRWHMTLSRFLRDYLYIPLGGNRKGPVRRYINLFLTMVLGGFWHGAGWGFILWGTLHGIYLVINHAWRAVMASRHGTSRLVAVWGWLLTFMAATLAWVPFRAKTLSGAAAIWTAMFNTSDATFITKNLDNAWAWIAAAALLAIACPNSQYWGRRLFDPDIARPDVYASDVPTLVPKGIVFDGLRLGWVIVVGVLAAFGLALNNRIAEFIYFQF